MRLLLRKEKRVLLQPIVQTNLNIASEFNASKFSWLGLRSEPFAPYWLQSRDFFFRFEPEISPVQIFLEFKRLLGLREKSENLKR